MLPPSLFVSSCKKMDHRLSLLMKTKIYSLCPIGFNQITIFQKSVKNNNYAGTITSIILTNSNTTLYYEARSLKKLKLIIIWDGGNIFFNAQTDEFPFWGGEEPKGNVKEAKDIMPIFISLITCCLGGDGTTLKRYIPFPLETIYDYMEWRSCNFFFGQRRSCNYHHAANIMKYPLSQSWKFKNSRQD